MTAGVELIDLCKTYPGAETPSVSSVELSVANASLVALLGPSGCGKTTTLKMVAGLIDPTSGDIAVDGRSVVATPPERRPVSMVFQKPLLFPHMTIGENVAFGLKMAREKRSVIRRKVGEMLELVGLGGFERRRPGQLSGGQEQRVSLARGLVTGPAVLLLDEPLSQLDANLRIEMRDLIRSIHQELGATTLFVTHDQDEAVMLADRIALMFDGRIAQDGSPRTFYEQPRSARVARFFGTLNLVPGEVVDGGFQSRLGVFTLPNGATRGPAILTLRQESIEFGEGPNCFDARVARMMYLGTTTRVWVDANGCDIQLVTGPGERFAEGQRLKLHVPTEKLWVVSEQSA